MPRTKGAKNKNVNTAKNKNIININVNSSKSQKGRGRPRKTAANTNTQNRPPTSGGGISMAPPQVIISQPPADNSNNNSLLSSFITSKMLNETMNFNRSNIEPTRNEQPSYFNARESIIPKLLDTPIKQEVKPPTTKTGPPIPPPPPTPIMANKKEPPKELNLTGLSGRDAMLAELKFAQSDEGKAEKERKKAEKEAKKGAQSTAEVLNMSFTPPKRDIDNGNVNNNTNAWTVQFAIAFNAPFASLGVDSTGKVVMQYGYGTSSDERIETNIKTIENALDKVLLLRGVEYNDIRKKENRINSSRS